MTRAFWLLFMRTDLYPLIIMDKTEHQAEQLEIHHALAPIKQDI
jgi:hypothetical protein